MTLDTAILAMLEKQGCKEKTKYIACRASQQTVMFKPTSSVLFQKV